MSNIYHDHLDKLRSIKIEVSVVPGKCLPDSMSFIAS